MAAWHLAARPGCFVPFAATEGFALTRCRAHLYCLPRRIRRGGLACRNLPPRKSLMPRHQSLPFFLCLSALALSSVSCSAPESAVESKSSAVLEPRLSPFSPLVEA